MQRGAGHQTQADQRRRKRDAVQGRPPTGHVVQTAITNPQLTEADSATIQITCRIARKVAVVVPMPVAVSTQAASRPTGMDMDVAAHESAAQLRQREQQDADRRTP